MVCVVKLGTLSLSLSLSCNLSFLFSFPFASTFFFSLIFIFLSSFSFSLAPSLALALVLVSCSFSSFFFLPFYSLFSSLPFPPTNTVQSTDQQTRRPTLRRLNVMWRRASAQQSVLSLLLSPPSSLLSLPSSEKNEGTFYHRNISSEGIILNYSF